MLFVYLISLKILHYEKDFTHFNTSSLRITLLTYSTINEKDRH